MTTTSPLPPPRSDRTSAAAEVPALSAPTVVDRRGRHVVVLSGHPLPFGATATLLGLNFALVYSVLELLRSGSFALGA